MAAVLLLLAAAALWRAPELAAWYWHFEAGKPDMTTDQPVLALPQKWFDDY